MDIRTYLKTNRLLMDGAMGTYFAMRQGTGDVVPEMALERDAEEIQKIHEAYVRAGAKLLRTDTFAANVFSLGVEEAEADQILKLAVKAAKAAAGDRAFIAGDIGPVADGMIDAKAVLEEYRRMCRGFLEEGIDIILFETFTRLDHIVEMTKWLRKKSPDCFIIAQFALNKSSHTLEGVSASHVIETLAEAGDADAVGFNCGIGSGHMKAVLEKLDLSPLAKSKRTHYFSAAPNAGYPQQLKNRMQFMDNASYFSEHMKEIAGLGADILGSCCGTSPEYTKKLKEKPVWECSEEERLRLKKERHRAVVLTEEKEKKEEEKKKGRKKTFAEKLKEGSKVIAVELDPPYDADCSKVLSCGKALEGCGVDIITMADSPMGRSRVDSILMGVRMAKETGMEVMPHVCCRDKNMIAMRSGLMGAYINGIRNFLIVTGDPVPGTERNTITGVFDYNSIRLMQRVQEMNLEYGTDPFFYGGALNYNRGRLEKILERMERKREAGASFFLTQPMFSEADIERVAWLKERIDTKILCGIMPFVSYKNAKFIQNEITGVFVPDAIVNRYHPKMSREEAEDTAVSLAEELTEKMTMADGFYFMLPFNRVSIIEKYMRHKSEKV